METTEQWTSDLENKSIEITETKQHKEIYTGKGGGKKNEKRKASGNYGQ